MSPQTKNTFLGALNSADRARLEGEARFVRLTAGSTINEASLPLSVVFFPTSGLVGELVAYSDGQSALGRLVGATGVVGAVAGLTEGPSPTRAVALTPVEGLMVEASAFRALTRGSAHLKVHVEADLVAAVAEASMLAGCAACHRLDQRLASLLLHCHSRDPAQRLQITHELLCQMLGAQRTTVTSMMRALKLAGLARTGRGWLQLADTQEVARRSCGCVPFSKSAVRIFEAA